MARKKAEIIGGKGAPAERGGRADRAAHHEGAAGAGEVKGSKFSKEARDEVSEKEPGKSRGG